MITRKNQSVIIDLAILVQMLSVENYIMIQFSLDGYLTKNVNMKDSGLMKWIVKGQKKDLLIVKEDH